MENDNMVIDRIVREKERARITGISKSTWWDLEQEGNVPKKIALSKNLVGWRLSALMEWIEEREAA